MNGTIHNQRHGTKRVRFHYRPPQKVALTAFDRQRAMLIGIVVLFAVFALSFTSVYQNLTGFVTASVPNTKYSIMAVPDADLKKVLVSVEVGTEKVNGVYLELYYYCPPNDNNCIDICSFLKTGSGVAVTGKAWGSTNGIKEEEKFEEIKCVDKKLKFSDATLNNDKVKTGKIDLFSFPITKFVKASDNTFTLIANPVNVYEVEKSTDLFPTQDYVLTISLAPPVCGDGKCEGGETEASCAKDCKSGGDNVVTGGTNCGNKICDPGETYASCPQECPQDIGSPGGGGGGGGGCVPQWSCGSWGLCNNTKQQSRSCIDIGKQCTNKKPKIENQSCICQESWICSAWSSCVNGKNTRTCTDDRKCGTVLSKPVESKGCSQAIPEYVSPQQMYQPQVQQQYTPQPQVSTPAVEQKPEATRWEQYKEWIVGIPMLLLFITILVITVLHFTKKQPQVTFNYEELKDWIKKERDAGTSDGDIEVILAQNTGWTKEEVEKIFAEMGAGQKVVMPKAAS